ncbi:mesoderm induction early response protein 1a isoform X2 [Hoplias malabaricus]|uniref:mesoderm induction early response protein 1a isoform X2 n=1 Tax=Hoplias malabaricus TaxID=27720 RepID=UPI0034629C20
MAELSLSGVVTQGDPVRDEDGDFQPSADMLVHDFDDEQTLEEEEMLQGETNFSSEIDDLTREGEMPIHELLKMYGYGGGDSAEEEEEETEEQDVTKNDQRSTAQGKVKANKDRESCDREEDTNSSSEESGHCRRAHSTTQLLCPEPCSYFDGNDAEESEDEEYIPSEEWKKEVKVGPMYQAETPGLCKYEEDEKAYENDDQLLWNPELLPEKEVVEYLAEASKRTGEETSVEAVPDRPLIKDNEQALFELVKCNFNKEEALSKLKVNIKPAKEDLSFLKEEENQEFEAVDEACGNDKSEEASKQMKLWRRKACLHPGVMDSTDQMMGESTELSQAAARPATSSCSGMQSKSEGITKQKDDDFHSTEFVACVTEHIVDRSHTNGSSHSYDHTTDTKFHTSFKSDTSSPGSSDAVSSLVRKRENEEGSETPLKRQKTEVEHLMATAVSGSRMEAV